MKNPNEDESILAGYTQQNSQFDRQSAVASPNLAREIATIYGDLFLNPTSTPIQLYLDEKM
jgi:hypothetical protein